MVTKKPGRQAEVWFLKRLYKLDPVRYKSCPHSVRNRHPQFPICHPSREWYLVHRVGLELRVLHMQSAFTLVATLNSPPPSFHGAHWQWTLHPKKRNWQIVMLSCLSPSLSLSSPPRLTYSTGQTLGAIREAACTTIHLENHFLPSASLGWGQPSLQPDLPHPLHLNVLQSSIFWKWTDNLPRCPLHAQGIHSEEKLLFAVFLVCWLQVALG